MPIGPKITDDVKRIIAEVYLQHKDWVAKQVMAEVHTRLRRNNPHVKPNWPGLSATQIELKKIRKRADEKSPESKGLDRPWSIGTLTEYDIPPEALPKVLEVQKQSQARLGVSLTIRQARWVGRLHAYTTGIEKLRLLSFQYSMREKVSEIAGVANDTTDIDGYLNN